MKTRCLGCMEEYDDSFGLCPLCGYEIGADRESPIHMQPGVLLHGRYLMGKVVGFGGFGVTYIAWDFTLQQKVAIKEYLPSEFATRMVGQTQVSVFGGRKEEQFGDGMEQFVQEAKRLAKFQSEEGIVRIYDSFAENNTAYIVMEYLEGETLTAYLEREGKIPVEKAISMLEPLLKSLEVVHQEGIIHRDIAPDNIYLTKDGRVKLIDFGAARYATTTHSRSLTVIIKPGYSPEEQYRSRGDQGTHTDVYAIAAVLYKMLTGVVPPESMERRASLESRGKDPLEALSKHCSINKKQENALLNALNVRVEDRTPTVAQFLEELHSQTDVKRVLGKIKLLENPRKWPIWAKISIPTAGLAMLTLLVLLWTGVIGPDTTVAGDFLLAENQTRIPGIINTSADVGQNQMEEAGLDVRIVGAEYSELVPAYAVLYQNMTAGQVVEKGTVVDVYVSTKDSSSLIEEGSMPYTVYKTEDEATGLVQSLGAEVEVEYVYSEMVAEGLVVSQSTDPGAQVNEGDFILLQVSIGKDQNRLAGDEKTVVLPRENYQLYHGDKINFHPTGGNGTYKYVSSDENVVKVDQDGKVNAIGIGEATITVSSENAQPASAAFVVNEYEMSLAPNELTMFINSSTNLNVMGLPNREGLQWSSEDAKVVDVTKNGKVTGKAVGTTNVVATWTNEGKSYTAKSAIRVAEDGIILDIYTIDTFYVGETRKISAITSTKKEIKWSSSDEKVANVDENGVITAVGEGKATITAEDGTYSEDCVVVITQPGISFIKTNVALCKGEKATLSVTTTPTGTPIVWSSNKEDVVTVKDGAITAVKQGNAVITAKMEFQGKTYEATCKVEVGNPSLSLKQKNISLSPGQSKSLKATTVPGKQKVTWKSSNTKVATVNNGVVKAVSYGSATITAEMNYNGERYTATCKVTIEKPSISVKSSASTITYSQKTKDTCTLSAAVKPDGGKVTWSVSDSSVAKVKGSGKKATVTAVKAGTVTVTATYTVNGATVKDSCKIEVKKAASTLKVDGFSYTKKATVDTATTYGTLSSNYELIKIETYGTCTSNALGISVSDTAQPYYFKEGVYEFDLREGSDYFRNQYRKLYELYAALAGLLAADNSVTMNTVAKVYDSSGNYLTWTFNFVIYAD